MFMGWAEHRWNENENCGQYAEDWTDSDWMTFKAWMNAEFIDYKQSRKSGVQSNHKPLHQDTFIR